MIIIRGVVEADAILVMKQGRIVEAGQHEALLEQNGYYSKLYESQMELECYTGGNTDDK